MPRPRTDAHEIINTALEAMPDVAAKRMFGARAFFTRDRMFAFLVEDAIVLKLPESERRELLASREARPFLTQDAAPFARWVEIRLNGPGGVSRALELARVAHGAAQLPDREGPRKRKLGAKRRKSAPRPLPTE